MYRKTLTLLTLALALPLAAPSDALACGGCFVPPTPTGTPSAVTGHRMAVALSPRGTTLWDQIQYSGAPEDFVWVLPVSPSAEVQLAENAFFEALVSATQITLQAPAPPRTVCQDPCTLGVPVGSTSARAPSASESDDGGVVVHHESVIGPYETATISSDDPSALVTWLRDHEYQVDDSILPTIRWYTDRGLAFAVLRLSPGEGVDRMQPVRVTVPGLAPTFPLRMVAAGIQTTVELELFVFAEGRIETANFGNSEVDREAITYDWASGAFDYDELFDRARFSGGGVRTNWVTEFAGALPAEIDSYRSFDPATGASTEAPDDWAVVRAALDAPYLTRLRTELFANELDVDLDLRASEGSDLGTFILVTRELNRAPDIDCPTFCAAGGAAGTDLRGAGRVRCAASPGASPFPRALGALLLGLALALVTRRRR